MFLPQVWKLLPTSPGLVLSTPGLVLTNPGLVLSTPGLVRNCRRLVKITSCYVRLGQWSGHISLKKTQSFLEMLSLRACIYTYFISPKKYSPVHTMLVFFWFTGGFECEGFDFKVFTWAAKHSHGRWTLVKGGKRKPSHRKTTRKSADKRGKTPQWRWTLENPSLHTRNRWKSNGNALCVKEWTLF